MKVQTMNDSDKQKLLRKPFAQELMETIRSQGNIEEFIAQKDAKLREVFLATDERILKHKKNIENDKKRISLLENELDNLKRQKRQKEQITIKIEEIRSTYPESKRRFLDDVLYNAFYTGEFSGYEYDNLQQQPKNIIERIKQGKKIKQGNQKLQEFRQTLKSDNLETLRGLYYDSAENIEQEIKRKETELSYVQDDLSQSEKRLQYLSESFDNPDNVSLRTKENNLIREFVKEKSEDILHPATISAEQIRTLGLSEEYIEGQILQSKYPAETRRSIRRLYEGLDTPAAPVIGPARENGGPWPQREKIIEKLKEHGLDVVSDLDPRAVDPNVFVVTPYEIHAPFLSPDEALKANIIMVDAVTELGGTACCSNPHTRESFVEASHAVKHENAADLSKLHPENAQKAVSNFYQEIKQKDSEKYLRQFLGKAPKNDELSKRIITSYKQQADLLGDVNQLSVEQRQLLASNILEQYQSEIIKQPEMFQIYQKAMQHEAWEKGISPDVVGRENAKLIAEGKPPAHVFHGGQQGTKPYANLGQYANIDFQFGAVGCNYECGSSGAVTYAFGASSHNKRLYTENEFETYGFLYQYQSRGEKQELLFIENAFEFTGGTFHKGSVRGATDETIILSHQNKLEKMYVAVQEVNPQTHAVERRLFPLELDETGQIKDKRWRDFAELHDPINDNLTGYMVDKRNNMIRQYDELGKEAMMARHLGLETAAKAADKVAVKGAEKASAKTVGSVLQKADNAVNTAIETAVEKGAKALNESAAGKVYAKTAEKIAETKVAKGITKTTEKIGEKVAKTVVAKTAKKAVTKVATKAVGKSVLKKIPLISLAAGAYFAYDRAKHGDWVGAAGELTSGTLGCFPGLGSAASVAVDTALAAKDIKEVVDSNKKAKPQVDPKLQALIDQKRGLTQAQAPRAIIPQQLDENVKNMALASKIKTMG